MSPRPKPSKATALTALLEVAPRTAKLAVASSKQPVRIERLQTCVLSAEEEHDPVAALRALLTRHPVGAREVQVVISREAFSLQTLELPSSSEQEITSMLDLQLGKLTPYPRAEILSASVIVDTFREGYTTVLLAIARKRVVEGILEVLKEKKITPRWVGVSTEGLAHWWRHVGQRHTGAVEPEKLVALIDVDATSTDCTLLCGERLVFSHSIAVGREQLAGSQQAVVRWIGELGRLPRILLHEAVRGELGRGVLCGVTGGLESLAHQLAEAWTIPVEVADSFVGVDMAPGVDATQKEQVSYTALTGFFAAATPSPQLDLIPQETRTFQALQVRARHLARFTASLAAVFILIVVLYVERAVILRRYLTQVRNELTHVEQQGIVLHHMKGTIRSVREWLDPKRGPLEVLAGVAEGVDARITITHLAFEDHKPVIIRGRADSTSVAFGFFERLDETGLFASVQPTSVTRARGQESTGAEFEVRCTLRASPEPGATESTGLSLDPLGTPPARVVVAPGDVS